MIDLNGLNKEQQEAVLHDKGPLLILAGAGSGKTRVITHRIAYLIDELGVSPFQIMAITFTNKAAKEMRERVDKIIGYGSQDVWVSTFHSTCARFLRRHGNLLGYSQNFSIYDTDDTKSLMRDILKRMNIDTKKFKEKQFLNAISDAKNDLVDADHYILHFGRDYMAEMTERVYREYQKQLMENNAMDFDDLLMKTVELFQNYPEALRYYRSRFRYIMVDEYQDTNKAQFEFVRLLAEYEDEDGMIEHNLCVVGDDDQSIYGFRGADIRNILDFEKVYPDTKVIKLEENYRSTGNILTAANEVIRNNRTRKDKRLWTEQEDGEPIIYTRYPDEKDEGAAVTAEIQSSVDTGAADYDAFAVLYRTNAQSRAIEEQCVYRGIPYRLVGGVNFYQRREIKDLLAYLKTIDNGVDSQAVKRILNVPKRGIGDTTINNIEEDSLARGLSFYEALEQADYNPKVKRAASKISEFVNLIESFRAASKNMLPHELISKVIADIDYDSTIKDDPETYDDRLANIQELINKAAAFEEENGDEATLSAFLSEVSLVADIDSMDNDEKKVTLMTLHSAKGLEFDHVFMVGMEDGLFPSDYSGMASESDIEEERRLCYVGITRARKTLHMSGCDSRFLRGERSYNRPSRFIRELPRHVVSMKGAIGGSRYLSEDASTGRNRIGSDSSDRYGSSNRYDSHGDYRSGDKYSSGYDDNSSGSTFRKSSERNYQPDVFQSSGSLDSLLSSGGLKKGSDLFGKKTESNIYGIGTPKRSVSTSTSSASSGGAPDYAVGDKVKHVKFGVGTVTALTKGSKDYEVTVNFAAGQKKMLASFAKLVKVD